MVLTDVELRRTLQSVDEAHERWTRFTRPADRRELSRHLAHGYRKLADHFRDSASEPRPAVSDAPHFRDVALADPPDFGAITF